MRYLINDDDLEEWFEILIFKNKQNPDTKLDYIISEIETYMLDHYSQEAIDNLFKNKTKEL